MLQYIVEIAAFCLPGILSAYVLFPKLEVISRITYSLLLALGISGVVGILFYMYDVLSYSTAIQCLLLVSLVFWLILLRRKNVPLGTSGNTDGWYVLIFTLIGSLWKNWFSKSIPYDSDPYGYAFKFVGEKVPDLGFYTGMAADRVNYIGLNAVSKIQEFILPGGQIVQQILATFLCVALVYLICMAYRNNRALALGISALVALGPIETFYVASSVSGHALSYIYLLPLFLLYKLKNRGLIVICLLLSVVMVCSYYTATMVAILASGSFIGILLIRSRFAIKRHIAVHATFLLIILMSIAYIHFGSHLSSFSFGKLQDSKDIKLTVQSILPLGSEEGGVGMIRIPTEYKDPTFLGFSAIRWQMIFFFLCGMTFIWQLIRQRKKLTEEEYDLLLCLVPVIIISAAFFYVHLPARIFDYFAFFGLLVLYIPKKTYKTFFVLAGIFILVSTFYIARDKRIFLGVTKAEAESAQAISRVLDGEIFSDMVFANQLISQGYYQVTGADDRDDLVYDLFYQRDETRLKAALSRLNDQGISYIALTKRMKDTFVLMVNYPQRDMVNEDMYSSVLDRVFDSGEVEVFDIKTLVP